MSSLRAIQRWIIRNFWRLRRLEGAYLIGILTVFVSLILAWISYSYDFPGNEFIRNTLAGVCSLGIGIILVNAILEERRKKQEEKDWEYARTRVISPILTHTVSLYISACFCFYNRRDVFDALRQLHRRLLGERKYIDQFEISSSFSDISKEIKLSMDEMKNRPEFRGKVLKFHSKIQKPMDEILNLYTPASLDIVQDPKIFSALFDFKKGTKDPLKTLQLASDAHEDSFSNEMLSINAWLIINKTSLMLPDLLWYLDREKPRS